MGIAWKDFEMPKKLVCDESSYSDTYGKFIAEPFERGYGTTLGNALRRVLLSSIEGSAVTSVKIDSVHHEFSNIAGVSEDIPDIILNIKELVLRSHSRQPKVIEIKADSKGEVKAKDIIHDETIEIFNPDLHIATLTKNIKFHVEMEVGRGRGYYPAEKNKKEGQSIGVIPVDSIFTPIVKVNFQVENTRVGQITDYDKLILEIWTNGSVSPKDALLYSAHILQKHLDIFLNYGKLPKEEIEEEVKVDDEFYSKLRMPVSELELSVRSANCLKEAKIKTIGELVQKNEAEMLKYRNFGKKSLAEIKEIITGMGLGLGMKVDKKLLKKE
ncbi:MAG: DNA-directed RNA polymerase subunit alpha [Omnitrophica WOR_2 bacterium RIFCSPLOWO2_12_FULL_51_24]|nr:MAG: DNA-directed RNA polymerase subunit alpha [Omnitrophica WOR_2 bacterium RIFCSPHIGHO2_01_FULL_49_10]OGX43724.1 MAG: DNA-directed RNA polymerase subunit alpha [Omnitrophica WOR_2 bacterium RIFCSPLOWO2_12_FULL_51_24]